ncbi:MAG: glycosyltransferase family 2 protein [Rickettsiales bacterium]|nr:glycosyltransferase family 2 protein [Rickettsiales bacterium]
MNQRLPISVYIIAYNEADRIGVAINSVKDWVDEVIVVDSGSSDDTVSVSTFLGAKVVVNEWPGYGFQKDFAQAQCTNDWVLSLDADEEVPHNLAAEIRALFAKGTPAHVGYILRIRDLLPGEKKLAPLAHTDFRLRLYDRRRGKHRQDSVLDGVMMDEGATTVMLNAPLLHRSYRSLEHAIAKMNGFTQAQAVNLQHKNFACPKLRLVLEFPFAFIKCYLLRGYFMRGTKGLTYALLYAFSRVARIAKYIEIRDKNAL